MSKNELVEALVNESNKSPSAKAVFHVFAMRQRARQYVSVHGLKQRMSKEGFNFEDKEYSHILYFLSKLELGTPVLDRRGEVVALRDIKFTLQSIGSAASGKTLELEAYHQKVSLGPLVPITSLQSPSVDQVVITLNVNNKPLTIPVPEEFTAVEIAMFIENLRKTGKEASKKRSA